MLWETKKTSKPIMKMTVHPKQCNTQNYIVIILIILDKISDMIATLNSQHYGKDV